MTHSLKNYPAHEALAASTNTVIEVKVDKVWDELEGDIINIEFQSALAEIERLRGALERINEHGIPANNAEIKTWLLCVLNIQNIAQQALSANKGGE